MDVVLASFFRMNHEAILFIVVVAIIVFLLTSSRRSAPHCRRCKQVNRDHAVYCAQCGERLRKK
jgi:hypothetical protein